MNERVFKYFNAIASKLAAGHAITAAIKNPSDIGHSRETLLKDFLANHLPNRLSAVLGGHIFGFNQPDSKQIDIIISNDIGLNFKESEKSFAPIENVAAVFSVKSHLDSNNLIDALSNIASIPQMDKDVIYFDKLIGDPFDYFTNHYPVLCVFAFSGMSLEATLETISSFYNTNDVPLNRRPNGIVVNQKYYIAYNHEDTPMLSGDSVPAYTFKGMQLGENFQGYPFFQIFGSINGYSSWLSQMTIEYVKYFNSALKELHSGTAQ